MFLCIFLSLISSIIIYSNSCFYTILFSFLSSVLVSVLFFKILTCVNSNCEVSSGPHSPYYPNDSTKNLDTGQPILGLFWQLGSDSCLCSCGAIMYLDQVLTEHLLHKWAYELQMAQPFKSKDECRSALGPFSPNHPKDPKGPSPRN